MLNLPPPSSIFFFFNDTATTEIYTLSLHDALPISKIRPGEDSCSGVELRAHLPNRGSVATDDKHIRPHKHYHSALIAGERGERLRIQDVQIGFELLVSQGISKVIPQIILESRLPHFG